MVMVTGEEKKEFRVKNMWITHRLVNSAIGKDTQWMHGASSWSHRVCCVYTHPAAFKSSPCISCCNKVPMGLRCLMWPARRHRGTEAIAGTETRYQPVFLSKMCTCSVPIHDFTHHAHAHCMVQDPHQTIGAANVHARAKTRHFLAICNAGQ